MVVTVHHCCCSAGKERYYIEQKLTIMGIGKGGFCPETIAEYTRFCTPEQLHAVCEDYRAGATIDFEMDGADVEAESTIQCPVLVIWGTLSHTEKMSDPHAAWPQYVRSQPQFCPSPCGHYPAEQVPEEVYTVLDAFFKA
jgi:haloacetate dehalogenase